MCELFHTSHAIFDSQTKFEQASIIFFSLIHDLQLLDARERERETEREREKEIGWINPSMWCPKKT